MAQSEIREAEATPYQPPIDASDAGPNGEVAASQGAAPRDPEFEAQMAEARRIMRERENVLRQLAK